MAAIAVLAAIAIPPMTASAAPPKTLWVSPTAVVHASAVTNAAANTSCATASYNTIQSAINVAPVGATINICAGTYTEQLTITQSVSLVAVGAVTVQLPASPANSETACDNAPGNGPYEPDQDGVVICGTATVNITGITVDAAWAANTCSDSLYGILVAGGATLNFTSSSVTAAGAVPLNGCQGGVGIQVGMAWTTPVEVGHATLRDDSISGYQKNGITVDGTGSSADIDDTTVTGIGATTQIAQNGIQISNGAFGAIAGSTITGNECDYPSVCGSDMLYDTQSVGVLFYGPAPGSSVTASKIDNNDEGVYNEEDSPRAPALPVVSINGDTLSNRYEGVVLDQGWAAITGDSISGGNVGIGVLQYSSLTFPPDFGQTYAANGTATLDVIRGAAVAAVQVESDDAPTGDYRGALTVILSDLRGNAARVVNNSLNYSVFQLGDL
ncbi:MAG: hypothetical protein ABSH27_07220 [Solirubrobacteraceae bacterium]